MDWERDETSKLGFVLYGRYKNEGAGKIVARAELFPSGVGRMIPGDWDHKRELHMHAWIDGNVDLGDYRLSRDVWVDDTSVGRFKNLDPAEPVEPPEPDVIYDTDAPNVEQSEARNDQEVYMNFRQWVVLNEADKDSGGVCSEVRLWYWTGVWKRGGGPPGFDGHDRVEGRVDLGNMQLPKDSQLHPKGTK